MDRYIGLDAHVSSSIFAVVSPGNKRFGSHLVEPNARSSIEGFARSRLRLGAVGRKVYKERGRLPGAPKWGRTTIRNSWTGRA